MSLVICDTNIFISLFRELRETADELGKIGSHNVLITSISVMELYRGMRNKREMAAMQPKLQRYNILHFNQQVSEYAVDLVREFKLSHDLQIPDAIIAAMSIVYQFELFTYNVKDFKFISEVKLYTVDN